MRIKQKKKTHLKNVLKIWHAVSYFPSSTWNFENQFNFQKCLFRTLHWVLILFAVWSSDAEYMWCGMRMHFEIRSNPMHPAHTRIGTQAKLLITNCWIKFREARQNQINIKTSNQNIMIYLQQLQLPLKENDDVLFMHCVFMLLKAKQAKNFIKSKQ